MVCGGVQLLPAARTGSLEGAKINSNSAVAAKSRTAHDLPIQNSWSCR